MQIQIYNLDPLSERHQLVKHACDYYVKILLPKIYNDDTYIVDVIFRDKIERNTYAETRWKDSPVKPKHCSIEIRPLKNNLTLIKTLAHEFTHVKQIINNELVDDVLSDTDYLWKRKRFNIITSDYWFLPWEIEANGYEIALVEKFRNKYDLTMLEIQKDLVKTNKKINDVLSRTVVINPTIR